MIGQTKSVAEHKKPEPDYFKRFLITIGAVVTYIGGGVAYQFANNQSQHETDYYALLENKPGLTKKIDELNKYIPMMKEPFASQSKDSLDNFVQENAKIGLRLKELKNKAEEISNKSNWSWLAFFME